MSVLHTTARTFMVAAISILAQICCAQEEHAPLDHRKMIHDALEVMKSATGYVAISEDQGGKVPFRTKLTVFRDKNTGLTYAKKEKWVLKKAESGKVAATFISNADGYWSLNGNRAVKLGSKVGLEPRIPPGLHPLSTSAKAETTLEDNLDYLGQKCLRITLRATNENLAEEESMSTRTVGASKRRFDRKPAVIHVYTINKPLGVIVGFQAIDKEGNVVTDISFKSFEITSSLSSSDFDLPEGAIIEDLPDNHKSS